MLLFSVTYQILHSGNLDGNGKAFLLNMFFFSNVMLDYRTAVVVVCFL